MKTKYYGHRESSKGYTVADWIWGHRFIDGQHWMEYMLEFLNVLVGFDYELGKGCDQAEGDNPRGYRRLERLGLRRFVFYDEYEKSKDSRDDFAIAQLKHKLVKEKLGGRNVSDKSLETVKQLLRSFSAIEVQRSWFAKSLFPAHESLLFWEALRPKAGTGEGRHDIDPSTPVSSVDKEISLTARNFFARGGEMYYLMLSAGTESDQERRSRISRNIKRLLQSHNKSIGRLAAIIDETWDELKNGSGNENSNGSATKDGGYPLGWLPTPHCEIYRLISEDVDLFLQSELDPLEALDLLAHLICFHIVQFIYHRSVIEPGNNRCEEGNCAGARSVEILVDALDGSEPVLRKESSQLYKVHEHSQSERAKTHIKATLELLSKSTSGDHLSTVEFAETVQKHFNIADTNSEKKKKGKEKKVVSDYKAKREKLCSEYELTSQQFLDKFADSFSPVVMDRFKDQFLGVHRKLCRSIGLVGPRKGAGQRFVLEDTLLKALVLANVSPHSDTTFDEFLARLYQRYGIVVGQVEAKSSGLYERRKINAGYYDDNRSALHEKLKRAGLLTEYSDATSLVSNRFKGKQKND